MACRLVFVSTLCLTVSTSTPVTSDCHLAPVAIAVCILESLKDCFLSAHGFVAAICEVRRHVRSTTLHACPRDRPVDHRERTVACRISYCKKDKSKCLLRSYSVSVRKQGGLTVNSQTSGSSASQIKTSHGARTCAGQLRWWHAER
jgi:hypothetical protein